MDISETYIKMRLAARKDLLDGTPPLLGWDECNWLTDHVFVDVKGDFYYANESEQCQLERQNQLQAMVGYNKPSGTQLQLFFVFTLTQQQVSWEQLWLAFVMKERYSKRWNGQEWVSS